MVQIELMEGEDTVEVFVATHSQTKHNEWEVEKNVHEEVRGLLLQENITNKTVTPEHTAPALTHEPKSPTGETNIWEAL